MERKQHWFRSDLAGPLPFAQVENSPEELNGLKKIYIKFTIYLKFIAINTGPERCLVMKYLDLHCC